MITSQPQSRTVAQGDNASFSVSASSTAPITYQWLYNTSAVFAQTNDSLFLTNIQPTNAGNYTVVVANYADSATSAPAALLVRPLLVMDRNLILTWDGAYTLQVSTNLSEPFVDLPGAANPFTNHPTDSPQQFFRLRN